jgi:hypothetical protein
MAHKNEHSLNDCQKNWYNNNLFVFLRAINIYKNNPNIKYK